MMMAFNLTWFALFGFCCSCWLHYGSASKPYLPMATDYGAAHKPGRQVVPKYAALEGHHHQHQSHQPHHHQQQQYEPQHSFSSHHKHHGEKQEHEVPVIVDIGGCCSPSLIFKLQQSTLEPAAAYKAQEPEHKVHHKHSATSYQSSEHGKKRFYESKLPERQQYYEPQQKMEQKKESQSYFDWYQGLDHKPIQQHHQEFAENDDYHHANRKQQQIYKPDCEQNAKHGGKFQQEHQQQPQYQMYQDFGMPKMQEMKHHGAAAAAAPKFHHYGTKSSGKLAASGYQTGRSYEPDPWERK